MPITKTADIIQLIEHAILYNRPIKKKKENCLHNLLHLNNQNLINLYFIISVNFHEFNSRRCNSIPQTLIPMCRHPPIRPLHY